jgi:phage-related protein
LILYRIRYTVNVGEDRGKAKVSEPDQPTRKPLVWLQGEIKTPPFTAEGRQEAGMMLRLIQEGEHLRMPQAEPLPNVGARCGALRVRDAEHNWRIMYRADSDAILILEVYPKKTRKIPDEVIKRCKDRLNRYDEAVKAAKKK